VRSLILVFLAGLTIGQPVVAQTAQVPPPVEGVAFPAGIDPDAYCFMRTSILKAALLNETGSDTATQREAAGIASPFYLGALNRRFDSAGVNAVVVAAMKMADKTPSDTAIREALLCAYAARDKMHDVANGMRAGLGLPEKRP